jgi:hypothetical protein
MSHHSNRLRVEVRLSVLVHVGPYLIEGEAPERPPDASQSDVTQVRLASVGEFVPAHDAASDVLAGMLGHSATVLGERLRCQLRESGK